CDAAPGSRLSGVGFLGVETPSCFGMQGPLRPSPSHGKISTWVRTRTQSLCDGECLLTAQSPGSGSRPLFECCCGQWAREIVALCQVTTDLPQKPPGLPVLDPLSHHLALQRTRH